MPRTIAIGDIHGCSKALDALIEAINPTPDDTIVMLGDYVDRGPDSRGVIETLIALGRRCRVVSILGNHEEMMLEALDGQHPFDWFGCGGLQTIDSYGPGRSFDQIPKEHLDFLEACRPFHETKTHIFAHANYDPDVPMDEQGAGMLRWESLHDFQPGPHESGKRVIVGHSSQRSGEILDLGHLVCIDTFCHGGGWLTALEVYTDRVWQADREGNLRGKLR